MADEEEVKEGGGNKMIVIILIAIIVLLLAGGGAFFFMQQSAPPPAAVEGETGAEGGDATEAALDKASLGESMELDPFIVNLTSTTGVDRYLKVVLVLVVSNEKVKEEVVNKTPQLKDSIITVLSSKSPDEVLTIQGKHDLKIELVKRINTVVTTGVARELFFTEFVVQ